MSLPPANEPSPSDTGRTVLLNTAWHALFWLVVANVIGLLLAILLLWPGLNGWLGEWTYGRWMPLHLNLHLYGWCSLPLIAWLFHVYGTDSLPAANWARTGLWAWSGALGLAALTWLNGHTSGKLFLDWTGFTRVLFPLANFVLWLVLAWSLVWQWRRFTPWRRASLTVGLVVLLPVPWMLYWSAGPDVYPPVDPGTGGPTGASLLGSTLGIILIMLLLPFGIGKRPIHLKWQVPIVWGFYGLLILTFLRMKHGNASHWEHEQIFGLGCLVIWVPLLITYYRSFGWSAAASLWRNAFLGWWGLLVVSAWLVFLPGALDRLKFTNGLVAHSHMAMAGFVSTLNLFLLVLLLPQGGRVFGGRLAFAAWQLGTLGYVGLMFALGWREGGQPSLTFAPGLERNVFYGARLACGALMTWAAVVWLRAVTLELRAATSHGTEQPTTDRQPKS
jgi:cytochrome c oxidase cbb3-type subunit 1